MLETQSVSPDGKVLVVQNGGDGASKTAVASILTIGGLLIGGAVVGLVKNAELTTKKSELTLFAQNAQTQKDMAYNTGYSMRKPFDVNINQGDGNLV